MQVDFHDLQVKLERVKASTRSNQSVKNINVVLVQNQLELNEMGIGEHKKCLMKLNQGLQCQVILGVSEILHHNHR